MTFDAVATAAAAKTSIARQRTLSIAVGGVGCLGVRKGRDCSSEGGKRCGREAEELVREGGRRGWKVVVGTWP